MDLFGKAALLRLILHALKVSRFFNNGNVVLVEPVRLLGCEVLGKWNEDNLCMCIVWIIVSILKQKNINVSYSEVVITPDFESCIPGSNPGRRNVLILFSAFSFLLFAFGFLLFVVRRVHQGR